MGRTSKFSFPYPGRRQASKEPKAVTAPYVVSTHVTSKAQKILGTAGDLNIDSPIRERDDNISWSSFRRPSSGGMSVAISESTQADDLSYASNNYSWDDAYGGELRTKPSSTVLGRRYQDEVSTDTSSMRRKLHTEYSSSTLQSYYDRQASPLSVSQQTSASAARDLALRKGYTSGVEYPRTPLLQSDLFDPEDAYYDAPPTPRSTTSQSSKKKPARLDLTRLLPKPRKEDGERVLRKNSVPRSPSVMSHDSSSTHYSDFDPPRKLTKTGSRSTGSIKAGKQRAHSESSSTHRHRRDRLSNVYEDQEYLTKTPPIPVRSSSRRIPGGLPQMLPAQDDNDPAVTQLKDDHVHGNAPPRDQFSWANIRASLASSASPRWEARSTTSDSSQKTKGSRHTNVSVISNSDLRHNSVLSMSSDEDSDGGNNASRSWAAHRNSRSPAKSPRKKPPRDLGISDGPRGSSFNATAGGISRTGGLQDGKFLTIPPPQLAGSRLSGPWNPKNSKQVRHSASSSRRGSVATVSAESGNDIVNGKQISKSKEVQTASGRDSRLMAVTKQEEALLEALRLKRARMKETIIAEHETKKSPSNDQLNKRHSRQSDTTVRGDGKRTDSQRVPLYLDTAKPSPRSSVERAEASPDLSDFLSFGSDDDEDNDATPRTSWIIAKDRARAGNVTSPESSETRDSPKTPQSAARLSAVGTPGAFPADDGPESPRGGKGVTFLESVRSAAGSPTAGEFLAGDEDVDVVWGL